MRAGVLVGLVGLLAVAVLWRVAAERPGGPHPGARSARPDGTVGALEVLHLRGAPREKGEAHGRGMKGRIQAWIEALRPAEPGVAEFAIRTCGERLLPLLPDPLREELEGIAEGAGVDLLEALYLNTRFELEAFGMVGSGEQVLRFDLPALCAAGPEVRRHFRFSDIGPRGSEELIVVVHHDLDPPLVLVGLPGMLGGFLGVRGAAALTLRPLQDGAVPVLSGLSWPVLLRRLLEEPPRPGGKLLAKSTIAASLPAVLPDGQLGTLSLSLQGGVWSPASGATAGPVRAPVVGRDGRIGIGEPRASPPVAPPGSKDAFSVGLRGWNESVEVFLHQRAGRHSWRIDLGGQD
ncbi:MAG: C45 family peptidase [Planctomycetota bacterium]|jgi:hypothetical protein